MKEESLLTGPLETTNEAYAIAKIAAIRLCKHYNDQYGTNFISAMPTNMYGPGDTYDPENSHVLPSLILKFHNAKVSGKDEVVLWGDGSPFREFLYSDDLASALVFLMEEKNYKDLGEFINVGSGLEVTIREVAEAVRAVVYADAPERKCRIVWDPSKPNGTPRKLMDSSKLLSFGWSAKIGLKQGLAYAYQDYLDRVRI